MGVSDDPAISVIRDEQTKLQNLPSQKTAVLKKFKD
jgi:hypothetical protein